MLYIKKRFHILSLDEFINALTKGGKFPDRSLLITFDDGWKDNYSCAYPTLKKLQIPAVIFLTAGFIGRNRSFWQARLYRVCIKIREKLQRGKLTSDQFSEFPVVQEFITKFESSNGGQLQEIILALITRLKELPLKAIEEDINKLCMLMEISPDSLNQNSEFLSWEEIQEMKMNKVAFGSHGVNHEILTRSVRSAYHEIIDSKRIIENHLNVEVNSFSYPNGNYDDSITAMLKKSGYKVAFTTKSGRASAKTDKMSIPRINIHEDMTDSIPMFLGKIAGLW